MAGRWSEFEPISRLDDAMLIAILLVIFVGGMDSGLARPQPDFQEEAASGHALGKVNFPTSCAPRVQSRLDEGLALLHSFQYLQAENTFAWVSTQEPLCAMAFWGKAMSRYEQLWTWPDARTFAVGREDIEVAEAQTAITPRERAYIDVARVFYQKDPGLGQVARMKAFSEAWEKAYRQFTNDTDVGAFYGLSLVALAQIGVDESNNRKRAIAVLDSLFRAAPDDPGPAHYLIHAADTPELASQGLEAARQFARIAPDSAHALHMPSHIFVRLGLWRESIASNRASAKAAGDATRTGRADMHYQVHAMDFLQYSYLQAGDETAALRVTEDLTKVVGASGRQIALYQGDFRARAALELHHWKDAESLIVPSGEPRAQEIAYWVRAIGAARSGDVAEAQRDLVKLEECVAGLRQQSKRIGSSGDDNDTHVQEARAWIAFAQGKFDDATQTLRAAANSEDRDRVDSISMPAREMLADMLLESGKSTEALREYELTLRESPNRLDALYGAAHAAESLGQPESARQYFVKLLMASIPSADRPEIKEARAYTAGHSTLGIGK
jgi:tetratricopeptide (TPR) repeat protein